MQDCLEPARLDMLTDAALVASDTRDPSNALRYAVRLRAAEFLRQVRKEKRRHERPEETAFTFPALRTPVV